MTTFGSIWVNVRAKAELSFENGLSENTTRIIFRHRYFISTDNLLCHFFDILTRCSYWLLWKVTCYCNFVTCHRTPQISAELRRTRQNEIWFCQSFCHAILIHFRNGWAWPKAWFWRPANWDSRPVLTRADNGSHFMTRDPCDPSVSWPVTRITRDPWPSPRQWHDSITTTYESRWVHDYCLLFSAIWNYYNNVIGDSSSSSSCGLSRGGRCLFYEFAPCLSILRSVIGGC